MPLPDHEDRRPIPDPTLLTTAALTQAIAQVRESYQRDIAGLREMLEERDKRYDERYEGRQKWFEAQLVAAEKAHLLAMDTNQRAIEKAEIATEKRFDAVNEFRNTLSDQQRTFMPRAEIEAVLQGMRRQIEINSEATIELRQVNTTNHTAMRAEWSNAIEVAKKEFVAAVSAVQTQLMADHEQKKGVTQGWGLAVGAGAFVLLIMGIVSGLAIYVK